MHTFLEHKSFQGDSESLLVFLRAQGGFIIETEMSVRANGKST